MTAAGCLPCVGKQAFSRVFRLKRFMKIWSVRGAVYSLESNVINLFNLYFINGACSYSSYSLGRWASCVGVPGGGCGAFGDLFFWDWQWVSGGSLLGLA